MKRETLFRLGTPLVIGAAILVSFRFRQPAPADPPPALQGGDVAAPSLEDVQAAFGQAFLPGAPGYDRGSAGSGVAVLEFADFGCPYCARFAAETWPALRAEFVKTGKVRWKYVPFVLGMFPNGAEAARAGECAATQGQAAFGRVHDALYARQHEWENAGDPAAAFAAIARAAGLDVPRFTACFAGGAPAMRVAASNALAERMGVRSTPTFFVNGQMIEGALPVEQFRAVLREALRAAGGRGGGGGGE